MDNNEVRQKIEELVKSEQELRESGPEQARQPGHTAQLRSIEIQLDQCWDLLRQRQARVHAGENPDEARVRPAGEVEGYRQ
ncbi:MULTISPECIES: DUF2630 family protein [unclassified Arthrobacter]|uniref:DUF2630 family protein n=1 Tax=unclassified Arthrobacter TaxID=235627 RepID=UPI00159E0188|nr:MULTISPECIES: DUF2630 family protein [unclassified Arthrobacter]MCQ9165343.1 DUF2630 family protein [Arthrobacter sp. STN4]NVN00140.1 DUF2630 family protein [Arthrobacter sp. SDTb3-6]